MYEAANKVRIPLDKLKAGFLYKIKARNSNCGIYRANKVEFLHYECGEYEIARNKFARDFLDSEYDYANGPPCGTAVPVEEIEQAPEFVNKEEKLAYLLNWRDKLGDY